VWITEGITYRNVHKANINRQPLPPEMLPRDLVPQYRAYSLVSSFRSLAYALTLKEVFKRKTTFKVLRMNGLALLSKSL